MQKRADSPLIPAFCDHIKGVLRGPWRPFVALRGQKRCSSRSFVVLRGPSRPFVDKKGVLRGPSRPFVDKKGFSVALRGSSPLNLRGDSASQFHCNTLGTVKRAKAPDLKRKCWMEQITRFGTTDPLPEVVPGIRALLYVRTPCSQPK